MATWKVIVEVEVRQYLTDEAATSVGNYTFKHAGTHSEWGELVSVTPATAPKQGLTGMFQRYEWYTQYPEASDAATAGQRAADRAEGRLRPQPRRGGHLQGSSAVLDPADIWTAASRGVPAGARSIMSCMWATFAPLGEGAHLDENIVQLWEQVAKLVDSCITVIGHQHELMSKMQNEIDNLQHRLDMANTEIVRLAQEIKRLDGLYGYDRPKGGES